MVHRLNNFVRFGDNSGLILLWTGTGILSGPVAFFGLRLLISLQTSRAIMVMLQRLRSVRCGKLGRR